MALTDDQFRERMSRAAARTAWHTGKPAGAIERWTPARMATGGLALVGSIGTVDVRISFADGRFVIGQAQTDGGRQGWWYHVTNAASLADAHAAAWRILAPRDAADGVLAQLAADGVPMAPGWRS